MHIQVVASPTETGLITTNPEQVAQIEQMEAQREAGGDFSQPEGTIDLDNRLAPGTSGGGPAP